MNLKEAVGILKLKNGASEKLRSGIASAEEIERHLTLGYTHIIHEGRSYFLYINDDTERESFKITVGLPNFEWFEEGTGKKNWVLYNPLQLKPDKNWKGKKILKFNKEQYNGSRFELPINASSCCGMFSWTTLPEDFYLGPLFDTRNIVDMNLMFAGCIFPSTFYVGKKFNTSKVQDMRYMFYQCVLPQSLVFDERFDTSNVKRMDFMFSESVIPKNFTFNDSFDTSQVTSMDHMFFESNFMGKVNFNDKFVIPDGTITNMMFSDCTIEGNVLDPKYSENYSYVMNLLSK